MMKINFLNIEKPCSEDFSKMKPSESGRFCQLCEKNVVDFTQLSALEIAQIMQNSNGKVCARMTESQLKMPIDEFSAQMKSKNHLTNLAAGLLVASTLAGQPAMADNNKLTKTEINLEASIGNSKSEMSNNLHSSDSITFRGRVVVDETGAPLGNAEVSFITLKKAFRTRTNINGVFVIKIPKEFVHLKNVISLDYDSSPLAFDAKFLHQVAVLAKSDLDGFEFRAVSNVRSKSEITPIVLGQPVRRTDYSDHIFVVNGRIIESKHLADLSLKASKRIESFDGEAAIALCGIKGKHIVIVEGKNNPH